MPPNRQVTATDVARRAGVSKATVSYVLNEVPNSRVSEGTAQRVRQAASELQFRPSHLARALSRGKGDVILALLPPFQVSALQAEMTASLTATSARLGHVFLPFFMAGDASQDLQSVEAVCEMTKPSTVVTLLPLSSAMTELFGRFGVRIVGSANDPDVPPNLELDRLYGSAQADALITRGSKRLGYVWPSRPGSAAFAEQRFAGLSKAAAEAGLPEPLVLRPVFTSQGFDEIFAQSTAQSLDGIACFDDEHALAFLYASGRSAQFCPRIIGVDNSPLGALSSPSLSSVYPTRLAVQLFVDQLEAVIRGNLPPAPDRSKHVAVIHRRSTS